MPALDQQRAIIGQYCANVAHTPSLVRPFRGGGSTDLAPDSGVFSSAPRPTCFETLGADSPVPPQVLMRMAFLYVVQQRSWAALGQQQYFASRSHPRGGAARERRSHGRDANSCAGTFGPLEHNMSNASGSCRSWSAVQRQQLQEVVPHRQRKRQAHCSAFQGNYRPSARSARTLLLDLSKFGLKLDDV